MAGYVHPHIYHRTQLKKWGFPIPIPSQCENFPSKRGRVEAISTETNLFTIGMGIIMA